MRLASLFIALFSFISAAQAEPFAPDFRYVGSRNMDFYGADLDALFDTDLPSCIRACSSNKACTAFTFNTRSRACFPKSDLRDGTPYDGAISAQKRATETDVIARAAARAERLSTIRGDDGAFAVQFARRIGLRHSANGRSVEDLLAAVTPSQTARSIALVGAAVSQSDRADLWTEYARLVLLLPQDTPEKRKDVRSRARAAALNGYLRGETAAIRAQALFTLAQAYETSGRGKDSLSALRLALQEQSRDDIAVAYERAVAKYGFRVTETKVESDSAQPRLCIIFSEPLAKTGVDYEIYLRLPSGDLVAQPDGNQLCIDGVAHGQRYKITARAGLPSADNQTLLKDFEVIQYVRDRTPSVRFAGRSYVLAKTGDAALPVETVNATTVDLRLRRISDRNLLRSVQDGYFGRPLSQWQEQIFGSEIAEDVWTGTATVTSELNRDVTTRLPLSDAIADQPAGIYALSASLPGSDPYANPSATQWFVLSDLGIVTQSGTDGLHVLVHSLQHATPKAGVEVTLVSRANAELATVVTDTSGVANFAPGLTRGTAGAAPALVIARSGEDDLGFLSLTEPAFDLSDRGVAGRPSAGPVDMFMTTDRGAYRAGETIHVTALTRDATAAAIEDLPVTAILTRPDGVTYHRKTSTGGQAGGHVFAFPTTASVPRGTWRVDVKTDPKKEALASQTVLIEDFLPERIDFDLSLPDGPVRLTDTPGLDVSARYLFGAPGAGLMIEGDVTLRPKGEIAAFPGFRFGRYDMANTPRSNSFGGIKTDIRGAARLPLSLPGAPVSGVPYELGVTARLSDGAARPVERRITAQVQSDSALIGLKAMFEDVVPERGEAQFDVIGLSSDLAPQEMRVKWTLNRIETRYQWYQQYGNWNWEPITRRTRVATGEADIGGEPVRLSAAVEWGRYEMVVERVDGTYIASAVDFHAGWYAPSDAGTTPDRLELSLDKPHYKIGDVARLRIVPQAAGTALVTIMSDRVIARKAVSVPAGASMIPLDVTEAWGPGAYVTAMVIRPTSDAVGRIPIRALGLVHADVRTEHGIMDVSISVPEVSRPRMSQKTIVRVENIRQDEEVWLTLAAVDLGILNLTAFDSPDPVGHYFGQRRLGMDLRDVYGRLIDASNGALGQVRSGGDADRGMRLQSPPPTQDLMAFFSGPIRVGSDGIAEIEFDVPSFNGSLRLMAVAWSDSAIGQAEKDMIIRDPVVVTASMPRFLAPGDTSRIRVDVVHADGPAGEMRLSATRSDDALRIGDTPATFTLAKGAKATFDIPVEGVKTGDPSIALTLVTPDGTELVQKLRLPVRSNDPVVARTRRFALAGSDSFHFTRDVFADFRAGTARAVLSAGPLAKFDAPGLLTLLNQYPYGCTEQTTSGALPLLYLSSVAQASGLGTLPDINQKIASAIDRILTRQAPNGAFGLWRAQAGDVWLDSYVTDFLSRAAAAGHAVGERPLRMALDNLRNRVAFAPDFDTGGRDIAYALMVLAREGRAAMSDLRYYADVKADAFDTPLALAQLGHALASYGDQVRADLMFAKAARRMVSDRESKSLWRSDYGSDLRDTAGLLALALEARSEVINVAALADNVANAQGRRSTQEAAWTLLAAHALVAQPETSGLTVDGAQVSGPFVRILDDSDARAGHEIKAASGQATELTLTTLGVPEIAPPAGGTGYTIERRFYGMDGSDLDLGNLRVGDRFVTVLTVFPFEDQEARLMLDDPLPAGFEIDNPSLLRSGDVRALDWLDLSKAEHTEFRTDRFLGAVNLRGTGQVQLAYVTRAVSSGVFHAPAASVEDMYRPSQRAWTSASRVTIRD